MPGLELTVRQFIHQPSSPDLPFREEYFDHTYTKVTIPTEQAAIVLVDCWDKHIIESHVERTSQVCRENLRPVLEACRTIGVTVVHAPSPSVAAKFPQWLRYLGDSEISPLPSVQPAWPPADFAQRKGEWAFLRPQYHRPGEADIDRINHERYIDPAVMPQPEDFVVATGDQLHRLCTHRKILFLFYAGFATNICVPFRNYGLFAMRDRGYFPILLRDCTVGIENKYTVAEMGMTNFMIYELELRDAAATITSADFLKAAAALVPGAVASR